MRKDLEVRYPKGKEGLGIVCAHCGYDCAESHQPRRYVGCGCPGHLSLILVAFGEMPNLDARLTDFETWLENEPCTGNGGCIIMSSTNRMCVACRLRMAFFHTIYNAEAYDSSLGEE